MRYSKKVIEHFTNPQNVGSLNRTSQNVGTALVGAPECGDVMQLQLQRLLQRQNIILITLQV